MTNEELVSRIKADIDTADNTLSLYEKNKGLIYQVAKKYSGLAELDDLLQEGYIGLCRAVDGYEPEAGAGFSTYAWMCIKRQMLRYIYGERNLPEYIQNLMDQYKKLSNAFMIQYGRKPIKQEYCHYLGINRDQLRQIEKSLSMERMASLESPIGEDYMVLGDTLTSEDDVENSVLDEVQKEQLKAAVREAVNNLPEKESKVIKKRFWGNESLQQVGDNMKITREAVRQWESKGLRMLKRNKVIRSFADERILSMGLQRTGVRAFNHTWTSSTERAATELLEYNALHN